jgi:hypothetical protein
MEPGHQFPGVHAAKERGLSKAGRIDDTIQIGRGNQSRHHRGPRVVAVQVKLFGGIVGDTVGQALARIL